MNETVKFSVIIPVCNSEEYLPACLESVRNQTCDNLEVILIDDGSADGSAEICRRYAQNDSRIRCIRQENAGVSAARNRGLELARGEWILFVDADDLLPPDFCRKLESTMAQGDLLLLEYRDFCGAPPMPDAERERAERIVRTREAWLRALLGPWTYSGNYPLNPVWAKAYRRRFLQEHGIAFPEQVRFGEDLLFNLQVFLKNPMVSGLPATGYFYRRSGTSLVHRCRPDAHQQEAIFHQTLYALLRAEGLEAAFALELEWWRLDGLLRIFSSYLFHRDNPGTEQDRKAQFFALVSRADMLPALARQGNHFPPEKRLLLHLAAKKRYCLLRMLYRLRT